MTAPGQVGPTLAGGGVYTIERTGTHGAIPVGTVTANGINVVGPTPDAKPTLTTGLSRPGLIGTTESDLQEITVTPAEHFGFPWTGSISIFGRANNTFTTFIEAVVSSVSAIVSVVIDGVKHVIQQVILPAIKIITKIVLTIVGAVITLIINGIKFIVAIISNILMRIGNLFRGIGFGSTTGTGTPPPSVGGIHVNPPPPVIHTGSVTLTNFGTQDGWPRYLCFGPGTFRIADGVPPVGSAPNMIEFGPLVSGQIALLTTLPRLRGVVDLSPSGASTQPLTAFQAFLKNLISLSTNNNVPPLLETFESLFGILPPQGELYSLLKGRFTNPIPPKPAGSPPVPAGIRVQILNGNSASKIIAALTPLRRWPE